MKPVKEAKKFAKMFLNVVGSEEAPRALSDLAVMEAVMLKSREFRNMLLNPGFSQTDKENVLKQVAGKLNLSEKVTKFMIHLSGIGVVAALSQILKIATALYLEKMKRAQATVLTPIALNTTHEKWLKTSLKKMIDREVDIEVVHDPSLLGGILVKVGSTMYDSSIKGQLRLLKDELIKG